MNDFTVLPDGLPAPVDDGGADHLPGLALPSVALPATTGGTVDLSVIPGKLVVFCYPMTGRPGVPLPEGWDAIPGARGCTPQNLAYRDRHAEIVARGARVFGVSTQETAYQVEMAGRLALPFPILSDAEGALADALRLPTFSVDGRRLLRRLALIADAGRIVAVRYPVFPSDSDAPWALERLA